MGQRDHRRAERTDSKIRPVDLIVDGNSLYARAFWANARDYAEPDLVLRSCFLTVLSLINPDGDRIGTEIDRLAFCWDGDHRRDKGDRQPKPPHYHEIKEELKKLLTFTLGAAHAEPPAHEADDAVGTLVYRNYEASNQIFVVSGDKDLMQLHGGNVHYYNLIDQCLVSSTKICRKFNVKKPSHVAIALAIQGDSVDNIKGIKGWGPKKVEKLFESVPREANFGQALELILKQIPEALQDDFYASLERTLIDTDVPGLPDPAALVFASERKVDALDLPGVGEAYSRVLRAYEDRRGGTEQPDDQEDL